MSIYAINSSNVVSKMKQLVLIPPGGASFYLFYNGINIGSLNTDLCFTMNDQGPYAIVFHKMRNFAPTQLLNVVDILTTTVNVLGEGNSTVSIVLTGTSVIGNSGVSSSTVPLLPTKTEV